MKHSRALRNFKRADYSRLLNELQHKASDPDTSAHSVHKASSLVNEDNHSQITVADAKRLRKKALQNPEIRFIYSSKTGIVHDKDCYYVTNIDSEHFFATETFPEDMKTCPKCYRRALVRAGLSPSRTKDIDAYYDETYRIGVTEQELYKLTVQHHAQFCGVGHNRVRIKLNDDTWEIRKKDEFLLLLHNSYSVDSEYNRIFDGEFHLQIKAALHRGYGYFIYVMAGYSWDEHVRMLKEQAAKREIELFRQKQKDILSHTSNFVKVRRFSPLSLWYDYYLILDCNGKAPRFFYRNNVNAVEYGSRPDIELFSLRRYRVPRRQRDLFVQSMNALKDYSLTQEFFDYADACTAMLSKPIKTTLNK